MYGCTYRPIFVFRRPEDVPDVRPDIDRYVSDDFQMPDVGTDFKVLVKINSAPVRCLKMSKNQYPADFVFKHVGNSSETPQALVVTRVLLIYIFSDNYIASFAVQTLESCF